MKIKIENFLSYESLDLVIPEGITLITGENESGKTSLLNSIYWATFGKTLEPIPFDDVIKWGRDYTEVHIYLEDDIHIFRGRSKGEPSLTLSYHDEVFKGKDCQDVINKRLQYDSQSFLQTHLFSSSNELFISLTSGTKLQILQSLCNLTKWSLARAEAKRILETKEAQEAKFKREGDYLLEGWKATENDIEKLKEAENPTSEEEEIVQQKLLTLKNRVKASTKNQEYTTADIKFSTMSIASINKEIEKLEELISKGVCPYCQQEVTKSIIEKMQRQVFQHKQFKKSHEDSLLKLNYEIKLANEIREKELQARDDELHLSGRLEELQKRKNNLRPIIEEKEEQLVKMKEQAERLALEIHFMEDEVNIYEFLLNAFKQIPNMILDSLRTFLEVRANQYARFYTGSKYRFSFPTITTTKKGVEKDDQFDIAVHYHSTRVSLPSLSQGARGRLALCLMFALQDWTQLKKRSPFDFFLADEVFDHLDEDGVDKTVALLKWKAGLPDPQWSGMLEDCFGDVVNPHPVKHILVISHNPELRKHFHNIWVVKMINGDSYIQGLDTKVKGW